MVWLLWMILVIILIIIFTVYENYLKNQEEEWTNNLFDFTTNHDSDFYKHI